MVKTKNTKKIEKIKQLKINQRVSKLLLILKVEILFLKIR